MCNCDIDVLKDGVYASAGKWTCPKCGEDVTLRYRSAWEAAYGVNWEHQDNQLTVCGHCGASVWRRGPLCSSCGEAV